ncbi:alpha/beta-hydrolase [Flagelloscypha sp. PMI_526]|nr:alpha/beta-hydrolase [Flagelloscypha sp. PMI_526]
MVPLIHSAFWSLCILSLTTLARDVSLTQPPLSPRQSVHSGLNYVTDSGICETAAGVKQMSGFIDISSLSSMFFWFFESRHDPDNAPLTLWLNGGPGCSSLIGLFQENGTLHRKSQMAPPLLLTHTAGTMSPTVLLYLDTPIGAGFSYGTPAVDTVDAASWAWRAFQNPSALITAAEFITYFNAKNADIDSGKDTGLKIKFSAVAISDGKHDALIQYGALAGFASNAPGYGPLQNQSVIDQMNAAYLGPNGCQSKLEECVSAPRTKAGDKICNDAYDGCERSVLNIAAGGLDKSDLRQTNDAASPFPPDYYQTFLSSSTTQKAIGSIGKFSACNGTIKDMFDQAGDLARSSLPTLGALVDTHLPFLIWAGDADIKASWVGVHECVAQMPWYGNTTFNATTMVPFTIDGTAVAEVKAVGNLSFARVYGAGHAMPAFQPKVALEIFAQFIKGQPFQNVTAGTSASTSPSGSSSNSGGPRKSSPMALILASALTTIWTCFLDF